MKGFFVFLFFLLLIASISAIDVNVTGKAITGKPLQYFGMNISVVTPPVISLLAPKNGTYFVNSSIPLNYSITSGTGRIWYSLDSGNNVTITSPIFFNASEGSHRLFLYANNSEGESSADVSFLVNSSIFRIIHDNWKGAQRGSSTNFSVLTYEEVQNLSDIILEDTSYGKILFNQNINMTADENFSDNVVDLDQNIKILSNRIQINSTALPNFNKPATLWFYGLSFSDPIILIDGVACPSAICKKESYSGGVLKFNVTQSGLYTAEETSVVIPPPGGGGAGGVIPVKSFSVNQTELRASLTPGSVLTQKITIKNNLNTSITVFLNKTDTIKDFIVIENKVELNPGESKEIIIDIKIREGTTPDLYAGKILLSEGGTKEEVLVILEVESVGALLDVEVKILKEYLKVYPGEEIVAEIKLLNMGEAGNRKDIKVEYIIKDTEGKELMKEEETVSLETQTSWIKRLNTPRDIEIGKYILYVRATTYEGKIASASTTFEIIGIGEKIIQIALIVIIALIIILSVILYFLSKKRKKKDKK